MRHELQAPTDARLSMMRRNFEQIKVSNILSFATVLRDL
jgi:hypothetical protein